MMLFVAGAGLWSARGESRTVASLDDRWQFYPLPGFDSWAPQARLSQAQLEQLECPAPGAGWSPAHLPHDYAVAGEIAREANAALRAQGAAGLLGGREFEIQGPGAQQPVTDGKAGALNRPGRDAYAGHGYLPVYPAWYRREFSVPAADRGRRIALDFGGVYRDAVVFVNGRFVAEHPSGYTGFRLDVTDLVKFGAANEVAVFVDPRWFEGWWYEGAGIYRHVQLIATDSLHVSPFGAFVESTVEGTIAHDPAQGDRGAARLTVLTTVRNDANAPRSFTLASRVTDAAGREAGSASTPEQLGPGQEATFRQEIALRDAHLWSPEAPALYHLDSTLRAGATEIDQVTTTFGVRRLEFKPNDGFFLNDRRVEIKGVCNHHDFPGIGIAAPDNLWSWRIAKLQAMGANAYRCAHNPASEAFYDEADRTGLLVMDETRHFGDTYFPKAKEDTPYSDLSDVKAMVLQHRNHPSIIMWSLANEEGQGPKPYGAKMFAATRAAVRAIDPTRPTTGAVNGGYTKDGYISVEDILGMNYHNPEFDKNHATFPHLMIFGSEDTNAKSSRGTMQTSPDTGWCSQYGDGPAPGAAGGQPWDSWAAVAERRYVAGQFIWTGFDYRGEPNPFSWPAVTSQTGAMDLCGFPKPVYHYWQIAWKEEPAVFVFPDWNLPAAMTGKTIRVRAFSNCERVELSLNGRTLATQPMPKNRFVEWEVPYQPGTLTAIGYNGAEAVARHVVETAGPAVALRLTAETRQLQADGEEIAPVRVELVDAKGRVVPNADRLISFTVTGPARVAGTANGDPASHEANTGTQRSTFRGLCLALVKAQERPGEITVEARTEGMGSARVIIPVTPRAAARAPRF